MFGATGDLALRKLIPSLFHRWRDGQISKTSRIVGVSRAEMDCVGFSKLALGSFREFHPSERVDEAEWGAFTNNLRYCGLDAAHAEADWSYVRNALKGAGDKQRIFYLYFTCYDEILKLILRGDSEVGKSHPIHEVPSNA